MAPLGWILMVPRLALIAGTRGLFRVETMSVQSAAMLVVALVIPVVALLAFRRWERRLPDQGITPTPDVPRHPRRPSVD